MQHKRGSVEADGGSSESSLATEVSKETGRKETCWIVKKLVGL